MTSNSLALAVMLVVELRLPLHLFQKVFRKTSQTFLFSSLPVVEAIT